MATYQFAVTSHSREFRVKDEKEVLSVFQELGYEESELYGDSDNPFERGNGNKLFIGSYEKCIEDDIVIIDKATDKAVAVFTECGDNIRALDENLQEEIEEEYDNEEKYKKVLWYDYLQSKLLDDSQIAVISESGYEKLRFAGSYTCIISKYGIYHNSTDSFIYNTVDKISKEQAESIFIDIASQHDSYEDIKEDIRSLHSSEELTDEQYNYILENWDEMLRKHNL